MNGIIENRENPNRYKILIIDDNSNMLKSMELMLRKDFELCLASSGEEGLSVLDSFRPDFVLLDGDMGGISGYETCRRIKGNPEYRDVTVIHISANAEVEDRREGFDAGTDDYITKPFHYCELSTKLNNFIRLKDLSLKSDENLHKTDADKDRELELLNNRLKYELEQKDELVKKLKKSEEKYRNVVNNTRDGIMVVQDGIFRYINPKIIHISGYSHDELVNNRFSMVVHHEDKRKIEERHLSRMRGENVTRRYPFRLYTKDRKLKWVELREAKTIMWGGKPATLAFLADLTEQKQIQEARLQSEKMISVTGLAAGIAHEINNPLAGIMQSAQNILRRLDPNLQSNKKIACQSNNNLDQMRTYLDEREILSSLEVIRSSGKRASNIISNMMRFVKKNDSNIHSADFNKLICSTIALLKEDDGVKNFFDLDSIKIKTELADDLPLIPCIATEIEKVLINLLANAFQSINENKSKRPPVIIIRSVQEDTMVRVEVEDSGPGINAATQRRLFEPFFTTRQVGEGMGIGLSISYMVITYNHEGTMDVESDPEKGSKFIFRIPLERPKKSYRASNLVDIIGCMN